MIASVAGAYPWPPNVLGGLFLDNDDMYGLTYWYNVATKNKEEIDKYIESLRSKK